MVIVGELIHPVRLHLVAAAAARARREVRAVVLAPAGDRAVRALPAATSRRRARGGRASTADAVRVRSPAGRARRGGDRHPRLAAGPLRLHRAGEASRTTRQRDALRVDRSRRTATPSRAGTAAGFKTALVFWGAGLLGPGWLVRCLSEFAFRGVNLTRIESRPSRQRLGEYMFFLDLDGPEDDPGGGGRRSTGCARTPTWCASSGRFQRLRNSARATGYTPKSAMGSRTPVPHLGSVPRRPPAARA